MPCLRSWNLITQFLKEFRGTFAFFSPLIFHIQTPNPTNFCLQYNLFPCNTFLFILLNLDPNQASCICFPGCLAVSHITSFFFHWHPKPIKLISTSFAKHCRLPSWALPMIQHPILKYILCYNYLQATYCCFNITWCSLTWGHESMCSLSFWQTRISLASFTSLGWLVWSPQPGPVLLAVWLLA